MLPSPFLKFLATPLPVLIIGEKKSGHWFWAPHITNASVIAGITAYQTQ